jgi:Coenzyme PQQ synthesis protein D (PqqD)
MTDLISASRPVRADGVEVIRRDGQAYLQRKGDERVYALNDTAFALWELCDGETAVSEMVQAVDDLFAAPRGDLARDVLSALQELSTDGLLASA